jgi:hypothetical protein
VNDNQIEESFGGIVKKLAEGWTFRNSFDVSGLTFFPVDFDSFPASILAELLEKVFLGIERMPVDLGEGRDSDIANGSHC